MSGSQGDFPAFVPGPGNPSVPGSFTDVNLNHAFGTKVDKSALGVSVPTLTSGLLAASVIPPLTHGIITDFGTAAASAAIGSAGFNPAASAAAPVQNVAGFTGSITVSQLASVLPAAQTGVPKGFYDVVNNLPALSANGGGGAVGDVYIIGPTSAQAGTMAIDSVGPLAVNARIGCINVSSGVNKWASLVTTPSVGAFTDVASTGTATLTNVAASGTVSFPAVTFFGATTTAVSSAAALGYSPVIGGLTDKNGRAYTFHTLNSDGSVSGYLLSASGADQIQTASMTTSKYYPGGAYVVGYGFVKQASVGTDGRAASFTMLDNTSYLPSPAGPYLPAQKNPLAFDIVIYGATEPGLTAAIRAKAQFGMRVCIIEATPYLGGITAQGLTYVDSPSSAGTGAIGGDTLNTYLATIVAIDGNPAHIYQFEPKTAQKASILLAKTYADMVIVNSPIHGPSDILFSSTGALLGIMTTAGIVTGTQFIDASYECDLGIAALGKGAFTIGRESATTYGESAAGFQPGSATTYTVASNTIYPIVPYLNEIVGQADGIVQAPGLRFPVTRLAGNVLPFPKPSNYDPTLVAFQLQVYAAQGKTQFARSTASTSILYQANLANSKINVNGLDLPNAGSSYMTANWRNRQQYIDAVNAFGHTLLYCIQSDTVTMAQYGLQALQADAAGCGLCLDEFQGGKVPGYPDMPYWREGPRFTSAWRVLVQADVLGTGAAVTTPVASYSYAWDFHAGALYAAQGSTTSAIMEGFPPLPSGTPSTFPLTQIPAEVLMQPPGGCPNLLIPTCFGCSHIAWGPLRLMPLEAMLGEAAGVIASRAVQSGAPVQAYNYSQISADLTARGTVL